MDRVTLIAQLELHEGKRRFPYQDTRGNTTIGVGRNLTGKGLSEDEIQYLLNNDLDEVVADLATFPWFHDLDAVRQRVMVDFRFNVGPATFRSFKRMLRGMAEKDYALASRSLRESLWAKQVQPSRADRLIEMLRTGHV